MSKPMNEKELHQALLVNLIMMLSSSAMQQMGKLVDPSTGKAETNLEAAQLTIDMLEMIRAKTRGNLEPREESLLSSTLSTLQLTYVETAREQPAENAPARGPDEAAAAEDPAAAAKPADAKDPKFRKSYG